MFENKIDVWSNIGEYRTSGRYSELDTKVSKLYLEVSSRRG